jgi:hypothetical protein
MDIFGNFWIQAAVSLPKTAVAVFTFTAIS